MVASKSVHIWDAAAHRFPSSIRSDVSCFKFCLKLLPFCWGTHRFCLIKLAFTDTFRSDSWPEGSLWQTSKERFHPFAITPFIRLLTYGTICCMKQTLLQVSEDEWWEQQQIYRWINQMDPQLTSGLIWAVRLPQICLLNVLIHFSTHQPGLDIPLPVPYWFENADTEEKTLLFYCCIHLLV